MASKWKLYYVESDGYEDCFVVAKNKRSAISVECHMNGFEAGELRATLICDVPDHLEEIADKKFLEWSEEHAPQQVSKIAAGEAHAWPYYARGWLFKELGAVFRTIDNTQEMLLRGYVYWCNSMGTHHKRPIGTRALYEHYPTLPKDMPYDEETGDHRKYVYQMLGMALEESQRIEWLLCHSFIFAFSEKQRKKNDTVNDVIESWSHKTMGAMVNIMKESFKFSEDVDNAFALFIEMRNELVHDILTTEKYDIETNWGQRELMAYLDLFLMVCDGIDQIAHACYEASFAFGKELLSTACEGLEWERDEDLIALFDMCFELDLKR